jgi:hypothetical protein
MHSSYYYLLATTSSLLVKAIMIDIIISYYYHPCRAYSLLLVGSCLFSQAINLVPRTTGSVVALVVVALQRCS